MPYNEFVRDILVRQRRRDEEARRRCGTRRSRTPEQFVDDVSQVFLGQRLACANCHHHPYEKWSQDDYWGLAAFFGRVGRKNVPVPGAANQNQQNQQQVVFTQADRQRDEQADGQDGRR